MSYVPLLPLQTRFEVLVGAGRYISQSFITRAEKYENIGRIKMSLLALWSSPGSQASHREMVEKMRILLTRFVSELSLLPTLPQTALLLLSAGTPPCRCSPTPALTLRYRMETLPWFTVMSTMLEGGSLWKLSTSLQ